MAKPVSEISNEIITELPDKRAALRATILFSGKQLKAIAYEIGIEQSHLSKMINPSDDPRHYPQEKENLLMDVCGNEILLRWVLLSRGYPDLRLVLDLEAENARLRAELETVRNDRRVIMNVFKGVPDVT
ncbi:MAG: hypothetical protein AB9919_02140 [Geobacteraceae bacterium]